LDLVNVLRNLSAKNKTLFGALIIFIAFKAIVVEILTWAVGQANLLRSLEDSESLRGSFRPEGSSDEISMSKSPRNTHDRSYIALCIDRNLED
jgi:phage terminase large subunit-like protein